jgi:hypothetical protein
MTEPQHQIVQASDVGLASDPLRPSPSDSPDLPLFRFRLRHLLIFVAAVSALLAALVTLEGMPALALVLAVLVLAFHLLGTALGSQLRDYAARNGHCGHVGCDPSPAAGPPSPTSSRASPLQSPWYGRSEATFAWLPRLVALAAVFGAVLGAIGLVTTIGHRTSLPGLVIGTFSIALLSGWAAFLGGNFVAIVRGGLSEAVRGQGPEAGNRAAKH